MATTTNFGWETPDDTDLVKDGAAAIRTLGSSIDTSLVDLKGGTTGQLLSKTSNTDMDFTFINPGDIGGGMTLLSTTTLSGATTTISSINQGYNDLIIYMFGATNDTNNGQFRIAVNGSTTAGAFTSNYYLGSSDTAANSGSQGGFFSLTQGQSMDRTSNFNAFTLRISNYASTTAIKPMHHHGSFYGTGGAFLNSVNMSGSYGAVTAVTSLVFSNAGGNHSAGTIRIYGAK